MNKTVKIIIAVVIAIVAVVAILVGVFAFGNSKPKSNLTINSAEDLTTLVDQIYAGVSIEMPMLMTMPVDTTDADSEIDMTDVETVKYVTALENVDDLEYVAMSEPMMSSQAYSMVLVKAKDGADVDEMAKSMNEDIDERKWICVTAEKIYTATSGNVICLVMSNPDTAKTVYESFKTIAGGIGEEYERTAETPEMPEDMLPGQDGLAY